MSAASSRHRVLARIVALAVIVGGAGVASADLPLGARCEWSRECATKRCSEFVCKTHRGTITYYPDGASCRNHGECASGKCSSSTCGGAKARAPSKPKGGTPSKQAPPATGDSGGGYAPGFDPKVPQGRPLTDAEKTPCGQRLIDKGLHTSRKSAEKLCADYTPEHFAKAEQLLKDGYKSDLAWLLRDVSKFSDEQIACSKKAWDDSKAEYATRSRNFVVHAGDCANTTPKPTVTPPGKATQKLVDTLRAAKRFSTFVRALEATEVGALLTGTGPFTVIAPTDEAFAKLSKDELGAWFADKALLAEQVKLHVLPAEYTIEFLDTKRGARYKTLAGKFTLFIDFDKDKFRIENALGETTALPATNGVILAVDTVIAIKRAAKP